MSLTSVNINHFPLFWRHVRSRKHPGFDARLTQVWFLALIFKAGPQGRGFCFRVYDMKTVIIPPSQICCVHVYTCAHVGARPLCWGFSGGASGKDSACQCRRCTRSRFDPWVGKIPWRRAWQPTPGFLPGESPGQGIAQRSLVGCSPWGCKESDTTEQLAPSHFSLRFRIYCDCEDRGQCY